MKPQPIQNHISFIFSDGDTRINYSLAWGYQVWSNIQIVEIVFHIICVSKYNAHNEPLFKSPSLLKVSDILQQHMLKCYYKYINGKLSHYLVNISFLTNADIHEHSTRPQLSTIKP